MGYFDNLIYTLERWGVADVLLPFLLIFTIVYAVLEMTKIFGVEKGANGKESPKSNINIIVSLVMGLAVIFPHVTRSYPHNRDVVVIINNALPSVSLLLVAVVSLLVVMGLFTGGRLRLRSGNTLSGIITLIMILAVAGIFLDSAGLWDSPRWLWFIRDPGLQSAIIIIAVFALLIGFITGGKDKGNNNGEDSGIIKFFKGPSELIENNNGNG